MSDSAISVYLKTCKNLQLQTFSPSSSLSLFFLFPLTQAQSQVKRQIYGLFCEACSKHAPLTLALCLHVFHSQRPLILQFLTCNFLSSVSVSVYPKPIYLSLSLSRLHVWMIFVKHHSCLPNGFSRASQPISIFFILNHYKRRKGKWKLQK
jgi:hypothetical protein